MRKVKAMNNEMPDEIWAGTYFDQETLQCPLLTQNEWRERKMTGSEKYHHSRVVESLQKEIAELKEKLAKTEWQQIETAPKDGTEVILSKWSGSYATPETSFCWAINGYFKDGYWYSKDPIIGKLAEPTHWMPLSQPPTKGD